MISVDRHPSGMGKMSSSLVVVYVLLMCFIFCRGDDYALDDKTGLGRTFDGIGGLSGGGVSLLNETSLFLTACVSE